MWSSTLKSAASKSSRKVINEAKHQVKMNRGDKIIMGKEGVNGVMELLALCLAMPVRECVIKLCNLSVGLSVCMND
jgi:Asp/Glu/hydantoin racemase